MVALSTEEGQAVSSGSFLDGNNPLNESISLFLIQLIIILSVARMFMYLLKFLRQPAVIAEVVGGICLGPTVLGKIPGFLDTIFPKKSLPLLSIAGNFGLILYLFLVGMELDIHRVAKQFKQAWLISVLGIVLPFSFGIAISKLIYELYGDPSVPFTSFFIFLGVGKYSTLT
jgi:Kef-type K+ transport system membrane component KefB